MNHKWEKEWEKRFDLGTTIGRTAEIKSFIKQTIATAVREREAELVKEIEAGKADEKDDLGVVSNYERHGYNKAINAILSLIHPDN